MEGLTEREELLLEAMKIVYRKHCLMDDRIGWTEMSLMVLNILVEVMGEEEYLKWKKQYED